MSGKLKIFWTKESLKAFCLVFLFFTATQVYAIAASNTEEKVRIAKAEAKFKVKAKVAEAKNNSNGKDKIKFSDPSKSILISKNESTFSIILQSNPTTGYSWSIKNYDSNLIEPLGHKFFPPDGKKLLGAPGYEKWMFKVKPGGFSVPHTTGITLIYSRPWDAQGAKVINFRVVTKK